MNYTYTYTDVPTIFEIQIRELGWIYNVHLELDSIYIPAEWVGYSEHVERTSPNEIRYSTFRATYTFENIQNNKKATFHYTIGGKDYICEPFVFDVYPFYSI